MPSVRQGTAPVCLERSAKVVPPYRYSLTRVWDRSLPLVGWCLLNPSVADATTDDPTITRVMIRSRMWGFGGILVGNAFAQIATYPEDLGAGGVDPVGPDNDKYLRMLAERSTVVVCAWGSHTRMRVRGPEVYRTLRWASPGRPVRCLGRCKDGSPKHPLYLAYSTPLVAFSGLEP